MPRLLVVPLRYLMTCLAASMWPGDGQWQYCAMMLVMDGGYVWSSLNGEPVVEGADDSLKLILEALTF